MGIGFVVGGVVVGQGVFGFGVEVGVVGVVVQLVVEQQVVVGLGQGYDMDMVGVVMVEGWYVFDEEYLLGVWVFVLELVVEVFQWGYQLLWIVVGWWQQEDVDDWFGVEFGYCGVVDMFDVQFGQCQCCVDGFGFGGEVLWLGGVGRQYFDVVVVGVVLVLVVEVGWLG